MMYFTYINIYIIIYAIYKTINIIKNKEIKNLEYTFFTFLIIFMYTYFLSFLISSIKGNLFLNLSTKFFKFLSFLIRLSIINTLKIIFF